ncbi:MAG: amidohydrolase family protein [Candidatus Thorarchaeota archaeon]|nr:amidohydrolase family protein [Candidatus Thorarchaeota archaeon]
MSRSMLRYDGPIFDAHTHVVNMDALGLLVRVGQQHGLRRALLIVHGHPIEPIARKFPGMFVFAKYFLSADLFAHGTESAVRAARTMREEGFSVAKMHFAPFWSQRLNLASSAPPVSSPLFDPVFDALAEDELPVLIHVSDPDTYYAQRYSDVKLYGTKEEHLQELEDRLGRSPRVMFQVAHFAAQPETHRLANLSRMFDRYPNLFVDTGSARWMARELGKDVNAARAFIRRHSDRILFGTDCVANSLDESYYTGRYESERILFESDVIGMPLPFPDTDTASSGGTVINGLNLDDDQLRRIYWENAQRLYSTS